MKNLSYVSLACLLLLLLFDIAVFPSLINLHQETQKTTLFSSFNTEPFEVNQYYTEQEIQEFLHFLNIYFKSNGIIYKTIQSEKYIRGYNAPNTPFYSFTIIGENDVWTFNFGGCTLAVLINIVVLTLLGVATFRKETQ